MNYIIGIDQSTQGTKALLFDEKGELLRRTDIPHKQIINEKGWVEHDPEEILANTIQVVKNLVTEAGIDKNDVCGVGISNQRETAVVWNRETGSPVYNAIVWQCGRAKEITEEIASRGFAPKVKEATGLQLSPFFSAGKIAWVLQNVEEARKLSEENKLGCGTIDTWLVNRLTVEKAYKTDYSNASRTQMFNINTLTWDEEICAAFGICTKDLAEVCDSNSLYGTSTFGGFFNTPIPIHGVLGDSHGALFGQGCHTEGMVKATYGTGSSIMMNIGSVPKSSKDIVTSLAWGMDGKVSYVLEGNINYTGAVITWLKDDVKLISSPKDTNTLAAEANPEDTTYIVPAFTGLNAPYWANDAKAAIVGMTRFTGKNEIVKAAVECIAYQIADIVRIAEQDSGMAISQLRVDGGPTGNPYLMQFQSDILNKEVRVPKAEELSGIGAAYCAGLALGIFHYDDLFADKGAAIYRPEMTEEIRNEKYNGWLKAVHSVIEH